MRAHIALVFLPALAVGTGNFTALPPPSSTTLQPIFGYPGSLTTTIYQSTTTSTFTVDCRGASLRTEMFVGAGTETPATPTATVTVPVATSQSYICTSSPRAVYSTFPVPPAPTASPPPSPLDPAAIPAEAEKLLLRLSTALLYASLIANGGFIDELCAVLNPPSLGDGTGFDADIVQGQVCRAADIQAIVPDLFTSVVSANQRALGFLRAAQIAIEFVVDAVGVMGGSPDAAGRAKACALVNEEILNAVFVGYVIGTGTEVKNYVCGT